VVILGSKALQLYSEVVGLNLTSVPHIRLIAIDLDGTLLTSDRRLSPGALEAVQMAREAGVHVCLASGRAINTILPFADELGLTGPVVSCNGAYVLGPDREEIHHLTLPQTTVGQVLAYAEAGAVHTNLYSGGDVYFSHDGDWASLYRARTGVRERGVMGYAQMAASPATKLLFIDHREAVLRHHEETRKLLGSASATIALSEAEYIEFLPPGIDKAVGVQAVASALSLRQDEVAAVGDYLNDLEMVRWAGFSGAVANAAAPVREQARVVVASNDQGGAAEFILAALDHEPGLY
jgi:Cof subfamily protein (haloacid dehalogenase superfamily)